MQGSDIAVHILESIRIIWNGTKFIWKQREGCEGYKNTVIGVNCDHYLLAHEPIPESSRHSGRGFVYEDENDPKYS